MMLEKDAAIQAVSALNEEDFAIENHRIIFRHLTQMVNEDKAIDYITLSAHMGADLEKIGGAVALVEISKVVPTAANIEHYVGIVKDCSVRRKLILLAEGINFDVRDPEISTDDLLAKTQDKLMGISVVKPAGIMDASALLLTATKYVEEAYYNKGLVRGISSGLKTLDKTTLGFGPGQLVVIAGRTSMGKTALALHVMREAAVRQQINTVLFSLEMGQQELAIRMLASE
jgi:replicative DNA helicase